MIAAGWYDDLEGLIADEIEDRRGPGVTAADAVEDGWPGATEVAFRAEERLRAPQATGGHDDLAEEADPAEAMRSVAPLVAAAGGTPGRVEQRSSS